VDLVNRPILFFPPRDALESKDSSAYWWVSCIHCVIGDNTSSGKDCIGSTEDLAGRARDRSDGRDRRDAEKVDSLW